MRRRSYFFVSENEVYAKIARGDWEKTYDNKRTGGISFSDKPRWWLDPGMAIHQEEIPVATGHEPFFQWNAVLDFG